MHSPRPALVTQRAVRRLPRVALLLLCAAYVLPGILGRDPWRGADLAAFGPMVAMAESRTGWWQPLLGGVPADTAAMPHWLGAAFITVLSPAVDPALAARLPFAALLGIVLALTWYSCLHLARTDAAQPLPFAFGGEAAPVDYARAMADGALLALMATLGLLQLGHETTPEMLQLAAVALLLYGLAAAPYRAWKARAAVVAAPVLLAGSGAPTMALALAVGGAGVCLASNYPQVRRFAVWAAAGALAGVLAAMWLQTWRWRLSWPGLGDLPSIARQWLWFMWPAWPMALWTLWRWRRYLLNRHIAVPLVVVVTALVANLATAGSDRALLLALPALGVLAAFALPTLQRSASAAVDWFSMIFFTLCALFAWVVYLAMHLGVPAKTAANVAKLAPGFEPRFSVIALALALAGTAAWVWLVRWRTGRHREALWKSLVLPAGGVALCWLLLMTLWLPLLDYARSPRAWVQRIAEHVPPQACIAAPDLARSSVAALEHFGRWRVDARPDAAQREDCTRMLRVFREGRHQALPPPPPGWLPLAEVLRPTDRDEITAIYQRPSDGTLNGPQQPPPLPAR
jgi:4-amino-4-deoxy-L-arabinose transferase-like glycosyltransferase